jgi:hypothetical protein
MTTEWIAGACFLVALALIWHCITAARAGGRLRFKASCSLLGLSAEGELETRRDATPRQERGKAVEPPRARLLPPL